MQGITSNQQQNMRLTGAPFDVTWFPYLSARRLANAGLLSSRDGLTADREERVGLLALHRGHTLQRVEASAAHVHPALHLRLPEHGAEQRDGDDVVLLLGGIHLLGAPEGRRLDIVDKGLTGSPSYSSIVSTQSLCKTRIPFLSPKHNFTQCARPQAPVLIFQCIASS